MQSPLGCERAKLEKQGLGLWRRLVNLSLVRQDAVCRFPELGRDPAGVATPRPAALFPTEGVPVTFYSESRSGLIVVTQLSSVSKAQS